MIPHPDVLGGALGHALGRLARYLWPLLIAVPWLVLFAAFGHFFVIKSWGFGTWAALLLGYYVARDAFVRSMERRKTRRQR